MPPKKKPQKNAFFYFMLDYRKKQEARGRTFPNGLADVTRECSQEWDKMTPQQKGPYESQSKNANIKSGVSSIKYTSQGVPISMIEKEAQQKQEFEDNMNDYIKATVNVSEHRDSFINKRFYFIHMNWLCRKVLPSGEGDFIPVEFAVAEFSLRRGVQNVYHEIISIDVPMGYTFEATSHSEGTHKIGKNYPGGEKDFGTMYRKLRNLLKPETIGDELPPLYTTRGFMEIVPSLLSRMAKAVDQSVDIFRIYSIELLFFHIRNAAIARNDSEASASGFPTLSLAVNEIQKDRFDRAPGISCAYHAEIDESIIYCCRSVVTRWAYIICDFCCLELDIVMVPGSHCPLNTDIHGVMRSKQCALQEARRHPRGDTIRGLASMTGVTEEHRTRTSERTYQEEIERRRISQPLQIIDHSKFQTSNTQETEPGSISSTSSSHSDFSRKKVERDLRKPKTISYAMMGASSEQVPNMDEMNFPVIGGRGIGITRNFDNHFPPIGRGRRLPSDNLS